jgi:hypothetical protein
MTASAVDFWTIARVAALTGALYDDGGVRHDPVEKIGCDTAPIIR